FAFEQIKDNKGAGTPGVDGQTKTDWSPTRAEELARSLRDGAYAPTPVRRVYIPKKSGKLRPLGIPTFADRVVQSALKLILERLRQASLPRLLARLPASAGVPHGPRRDLRQPEGPDRLGRGRRYPGMLR